MGENGLIPPIRSRVLKREGFLNRPGERVPRELLRTVNGLVLNTETRKAKYWLVVRVETGCSCFGFLELRERFPEQP